MSTIHNPKHFDPADYEVLDYLDNRRPQYYGQTLEEFKLEVTWWEKDMERTFGAAWRSKVHHCTHCGNGNVRWITAVKHIPTSDVVVFGSDCTARLGFADRMAFKLAQLKSKAEAGHARMKVWKEREAFLAAHPELVAAMAQAKDPAHAKNHFVQDVLSKLDRYGSLSEKQLASVLTSLQRDLEYAARKAAEATEVKGDAPEGRLEVTGRVLSVKQKASDFAPGGYVLKMLVKLANNAKVWVTVPRTGDDIEPGVQVTFRATFERSRDDASFAFGKRPHLVNVTR